jgi:hypothetical protein
MAVIHPALDPWLELGVLLVEASIAASSRGLVATRRGRAYRTRRPGPNTPLWNVCAMRLREALKPYGAKARLARFLGIPRQRLYDYLRARSRLPDAELTLQLLAWLAHKGAGKDIAL